MMFYLVDVLKPKIIKKLWTDDDLCKKLIQKGIQKRNTWGQLQFNKRLKEIIENLMDNRES